MQKLINIRGLFKTSLLILISLPILAHALTVSPARLEISGEKGSVVQGEMVAVNDDDNEVTLYTSSENFEATGETGVPSFKLSDKGLSSWVGVEQSITFKPHERRVIPFTVTIPTEAEAGGHFAALFLSSKPKTQVDNGVSIGTKIGMLILFRVNGDIIEDGGLSSFGNTKNSTYFNELPINFFYRFTNSGQDRINPRGYITIKNMFGMTTAKLEANPSSGNVLPNSTRRFEVTYGNNSVPNSFWGAVTHQISDFALGYYRVIIDLNYGESGQVSSSQSVFVLPWQLLSIVFFGGGIFVITLVRAIKRYNTWIIKKASR